MTVEVGETGKKGLAADSSAVRGRGTYCEVCSCAVRSVRREQKSGRRNDVEQVSETDLPSRRRY